jgi:hypothetical protein
VTQVVIKDAQGDVVAEIDKLLYVQQKLLRMEAASSG